MSQCTCSRSTGCQPITPWMDEINSAQTELIRKNFASVKPMNDETFAPSAALASIDAAMSKQNCFALITQLRK